MKKLTDDSLMARSLAWVASVVCRHRRTVIYSQAVLFVLSVLFTIKFLQFDTNRDNLVGENETYQRAFLELKKEFPQQDDLAVVVESDDLELNRQFIERLGAKVAADTAHFTNVIYNNDLKMLGSKALLFVPHKSAPVFSTNDFREPAMLAQKLRESADPVSAFLRGRLSAATLQALANFQESETNTVLALVALAGDLNPVLRGSSIFDAARFKDVPLRPKTKKLLARNPAGEDLALLNRMLLEDAYPEELSRSDLDELLRALKAYEPFVRKFGQTTNLVSFFDLINEQMRTAPRTNTPQTEALMSALPALERILSQARAGLDRPGVPPSPGITALFDPTGQAMTNVYVTFDRGHIFMLSAQPKNVEPLATPIKTGQAQEDFNGKCVQRLREFVAQTQMEVPGLNVGVTGLPVLDYDEMMQSQKDTTIASIVSLIICALIFVYGYNETGRPIKATICLVVGLGYTMAFSTLVIGHLNILTITFVPMLVGLAIDFGVHLITRYEEELRHGKTEEAALMKAMVFTGQGIFTGAFTTAGAFLAMGFTQFKGIQEMGIICGSGLLICLIPMMTLLPVLLLRGRQNRLDHEQGELAEGRERIENIWLKRPVMVMIVTAVLCGLAATQLRKIYFDYNLLKMQNQSLSSVQTSQKLVRSAGQSLLYGAVIAKSASEAVELEAKITNLTAVASVHSMADILNEDQSDKLQVIGEVKEVLAPLRFNPPDRRPVNLPELSLTLFGLSGYCGLAVDDIGTNLPALSQQFQSLRETIVEFRKAMLAGDAIQLELHSQKLAGFQQALFDDLRESFESLKNQDNSSALRAEDLPPALRNMFIGVTGKFLVQVYPKRDVWQRENQEQFIRQLQDVVPDLTGMPVQLYHYTELLKDSYEQASWYSLGAIVVLVLFHFRTLASVVLALLPVAIGSLWLGGLMGFFQIPFNPANIMTLPLVIGIGVTNGIHILNRFAEEQHASILARSTGKAVLVSGLTALAGFGSLILATHQGIQSLGYVMATGIATCMIAGLTFLPALLNLMLRWRPPTKQPSADNALSTLGREEPRSKPRV